MRLEFLIDIHRPLREVFHVVGNLENDPKWQSAVLEVEKVTDGPIDTGTRFRHVYRLAGRKAKVDLEFVDYAAPRHYELHCTWGPLTFSTKVFMEPIPKGTRTFTFIEGHGRGGLTLALVALTRRRQREIAADLQNLKSLMESGAL